MEMPVLVTYVTRYGSTQEVAAVIAATLRENGLTVEIRRIRDVQSVDPYGAIVIGAALYIGRLHKDARLFIRRNFKVLGTRPTAMFVLGPVNNVEKEFQAARVQLENDLAIFPWFKPMASQVFGGKFDPSKLGLPFSLIPALRNMHASDIRNWDMIRAWAAELAAKLHSSGVGTQNLAEVQ